MALNFDKVARLLKKVDWTGLKAELDASDLPLPVAERVLDTLYRTDSMVRRHSNDDGLARDGFLAQLDAYLVSRGVGEAVGAFSRRLATLRALDKGYLAIFDIEARLPSASLTSMERIAGVFEALNECIADVERDRDRAQAKAAVISFDRLVEDPDGRKYDPGAVYHGLTLAAGDVVLMQAWREGYFAPDGAVELPIPGKAQPGARDLVKEDLANASIWREWKGVDERVRFPRRRTARAVEPVSGLGPKTKRRPTAD